MLEWVLGFAVVGGMGLAGLAGLGFVQVVGGRSGEEAHTALAGLFPAQGRRDWPVGVQESDAPRFDITHLDALRPDAVATSGPRGTGPDPVHSSLPVEMVELDESGSIALERIDASVVREQRPPRVSSTPEAPGLGHRWSQHTRS